VGASTLRSAVGCHTQQLENVIGSVLAVQVKNPCAGQLKFFIVKSDKPINQTK